MPSNSRAPLSTYRLQWQTDFGFKEAQSLVGYLEALGISDMYLPPVTAAQKGSLHGYAVVDPSRVNPELGEENDLVSLGHALGQRKMGLLVDFVPNHMGIAAGENRFFVDVLENGRGSIYAELFDIEWDPPKESLSGKILLPILGEQYGEALASGKLRVAHDAGRLELIYGSLRLPLEPSSLVPLLEEAAAALAEGDEKSELMSVGASFRHLPSHQSADAASREERNREKEIGKRRLRDLVARSAPADASLAAVATTYAGDEPWKAARLDSLLREQCYRPCFWRVALEATNYRRFFDVNDLAAIRVELPWVFDTIHELVLRLVHQGAVTGLRIDHVDGLYNPRQYLADLEAALARELPPDASPPLVVVEKILEPGEALPESFACDGTTGYDFCRLATGVLIDRSAQTDLERTYRRVTHEARSFSEITYETKRFVLDYILSSEVAMLVRALERIADASPRARDFSRKSLEAAIMGTMASFPVYRTYVEPDGSRSESDLGHIERALGAAARRYPAVDKSVFAFLRDVLLGRSKGGVKPSDESALADHEARIAFAMKFQQTTGPVMAKAIEDTTFYAYPMFLAANEVGNDPKHIAVSVEEFHRELALRAERMPRTLNATSTHDTKRSEDVRARLAVLSEMAGDWRSAVARWRRIAKKHRTRIAGELAPAPQDELAFYQTVIGVAPFGADARAISELAPRLREHAQKAAKEAKLRTSWLQPDEAYETALAAFVDGMTRDAAFVEDVVAFTKRLDPHGASNALTQTVLKLLAPGIPDFYQGSEAWHLRLVDPDNRVPVDFSELKGRLKNLREDGRSKKERATFCLENYATGDIKLLLTSEGLALRRAMPRLFANGNYLPLESDAHAIAFARTFEGQAVIGIGTRLPFRLLDGENGFASGAKVRSRRLRVPRSLIGDYTDILTGESVTIEESTPLERVLSNLPFAILRRSP